jgi:hypothetical protein
MALSQLYIDGKIRGNNGRLKRGGFTPGYRVSVQTC